jgi:uncharacterized protein with HEPN domain
MPDGGKVQIDDDAIWSMIQDDIPDLLAALNNFSDISVLSSSVRTTAF